MVRPSLLVRDDIMELAAGDQICADALVRTGEIQVNESSSPRSRRHLKGPGDILKSGSFGSPGGLQLTQVGLMLMPPSSPAGARKMSRHTVGDDALPGQADSGWWALP